MIVEHPRSRKAQRAAHRNGTPALLFPVDAVLFISFAVPVRHIRRSRRHSRLRNRRSRVRLRQQHRSTQEICHAQLHTAAAVKGYGIAVHALSLLIPGTAVLKSLEQHLILHILRIKADRFFRMLKRRSHYFPALNSPKHCKNTTARPSLLFRSERSELPNNVRCVCNSPLRGDGHPPRSPGGSANPVPIAPERTVSSKASEWTIVFISAPGISV